MVTIGQGISQLSYVTFFVAYYRLQAYVSVFKYTTTRLGFQMTFAYYVFKVSSNVRLGFHVTMSSSVKNPGYPHYGSIRQ